MNYKAFWGFFLFSGYKLATLAIWLLFGTVVPLIILSSWAATLLCTATAMTCMSSGINPAKELQGALWVQESLQESLGSFGPIFIAVAMVFFAFTTLLGNCFYCDNLLIYIHKKQPGKAFMKGFRLVSALAIFLGAGMEMSLLWNLSDVLMGLWRSLTSGYPDFIRDCI